MEAARSFVIESSRCREEIRQLILTEAHPILCQLLQEAELEALLRELDELIEAEGGLLIP